MKEGCGKEVLEEGYGDYNCGDDFPDDDGEPWMAYCPECARKMKSSHNQENKEDKNDKC